ncbi:hypothetical protein ACF0H5_022622 [Mactra antiquata]
MFERIVYWVRKDPSIVMLELPPLPGVTSSNNIAVPMMLLCVIDCLELMDQSLTDKYLEISKWSVDQILSHRQRNNTIVLENVGLQGEELPGTLGRVTIPGHAIEAGWFLLQYAVKQNDSSLKQLAIRDFIVNMFNYGWDKQYGGILYYLDVDKFSPVQLEWNMKLWWTHNEALIAFLMAYQETRDITMIEMFAKIFDYCYSKYVDKEHGEWVGYLNQDGSVSMNFKGGPWKGCFHVPRALLMCKQMLGNLLNKKQGH